MYEAMGSLTNNHLDRIMFLLITMMLFLWAVIVTGPSQSWQQFHLNDNMVFGKTVGRISLKQRVAQYP